MTKTIASLPNWTMFILIIISMFADAFIPLGVFLYISLLILWLYSLGYECQYFLPNETHLPLVRLIISLSCLGIFVIFFSLYEHQIQSFILILQLLSLFSMFYAFYFVAKSIRSAELGRSAKFQEYITVIFGLFFSPIGVWSIQYKMKRIIDDSRQESL